MNIATTESGTLSPADPRYYDLKETLLKVDGLHVRYGENVVLRDVNFSVRNIVRPNTGISQGQVIALLAPSGMGKTQLFNCISGIQVPTQGTVLLTADAHVVRAGMVGVVPQNYPLFRWRTVLGNLILAGCARGRSRKESREEAMRLLGYFGLEGLAQNYPNQISGGQRQRVAIARQILSSEHFLLMDEPFSGLDVLAKNALIRLILELSVRHEQETLIVTTHDIPSAVAIAHRVLILGREHRADGVVVPGAYIKHDIDLIKEGLAWNPGVTEHPRFSEIVRYIEHDVFKTL